MTPTHYSTKRVHAVPGEHGTPGDMKPVYVLTYEDGYQSLCPKHVFERDYQPIKAMSFGHALDALKRGERVARAGWNGKGMWLALTPGSIIATGMARAGAARHRANELRRDLPHDGTEGQIEINGHIDIRTADGSMTIGWVPSQTDMLADDWMVVR